MTRDHAIATLRQGLTYLPHDEVRAATVAAFKRLLQELAAAEELLDALYDDVWKQAGERKADLDMIVFSRRMARRE